MAAIIKFKKKISECFDNITVMQNLVTLQFCTEIYIETIDSLNSQCALIFDIYSFIHSYISNICIAPLQRKLLRGAPDSTKFFMCPAVDFIIDGVKSRTAIHDLGKITLKFFS